MTGADPVPCQALTQSPIGLLGGDDFFYATIHEPWAHQIGDKNVVCY